MDALSLLVRARPQRSLAALAALASWACAPVQMQVRTRADEPPLPQEIKDRESFKNPSCDPRWGLLFPGVGALCLGDTREGVGLVALGTAELGTGVAIAAADTIKNPGAEVALLAFGDLYTAGTMDTSLRLQRARHLLYVPQQTLPQLLEAPFNPRVLADPLVWGGIAGTLGISLLYTRLTDGPYDATRFSTRPVLFGKTTNSAVGYPLAGAIGIGLFSHVALAEEMAFRGLLQGGMVRSLGETQGWLAASLIFGLFHASNVIFLDPQDRVDYLLKGVPFITALGAYLGYVYKQQGYNLEGSMAVHFWYDFLLEAVAFVLDPKNSPLAFSTAF